MTNDRPVQVHCNHEALADLQADGFPVADYDGLAIFDAASTDKIREVFSDQEYKDVVVPDEERFVDRKRVLTWPARIVNVFDDPC